MAQNIFLESPDIKIGTTCFNSKDDQGRSFDLLDRAPMGKALTELVDRIDQPTVIALDGEWGSGKSHFLKLWAGSHKHDPDFKGKAALLHKSHEGFIL